MLNTPELLHDFWYVAAHGSAVGTGKMVPVTLLGQQILLGRDSKGEVFALRDFCPHRGMPLRYGKFDGEVIECCYHGWCFDTEGACTSIPSLPEEETAQISKIKTASFPCREVDGVIWVYVPTPKTRLPDVLPELLPNASGLQHKLVESVIFPCHIDHAVIGLMDPSHGPFVHRSWWWRTKKSMHLKKKNFGPVGVGFRMLSHKPSSNSRAYKILGSSERKTEISFQLPGLRTEHIRIGETSEILLLTALTPIDEGHTQLHQFIATNIPLVHALLPLLKPFGKAFIAQDMDVVVKQQEGLKGNPALMLMGDADQQALWYYKLKRAWATHREDNEPFVNPVPEKTLQWRS